MGAFDASQTPVEEKSASKRIYRVREPYNNTKSTCVK